MEVCIYSGTTEAYDSWKYEEKKYSWVCALPKNFYNSIGSHWWDAKFFSYKTPGCEEIYTDSIELQMTYSSVTD